MKETDATKSYNIRENRENDRGDVVASLIEVLKIHDPNFFNPYWIESIDRNLYRRLLNHIRVGKREYNWSIVVEALDEEWQARWRYNTQRAEAEIKENRTFAENIQDLVVILEKNNPLKFGPSWIERQTDDPGLHYRITKQIRTEKGKLDWPRVVDALPEKWRGRYKSRKKRHNDRSPDDWKVYLIGQFHEFLSKNEGITVLNPILIYKKDKLLYQRITHAIRQGVIGGWEDLVYSADKRWQDRWKYEKKRNFEGIIGDLEKLLEQENPAVVRPRWIRDHDVRLFEKLVKRLRRGHGRIDWERVPDALTPKWKARWRYAGYKQPSKRPENFYRDEKEIEDALAPYIEKLYTILALSKDDDKEIRNQICLLFVKLIKKGNIAAKEKFETLIWPLIREWIDTYPDFAVFIHDAQSIHKIVDGCMYNARDDSLFIPYLFSSMRSFAQGQKGRKTVSLDEPFGDNDSRTLLDKIKSPSNDET